MNWREVCEHPSLKDLPFKIELDEFGRVVMSPVKLYHSFFQGEIAFLLHSLLKDGKTLPECAIKTAKGTKVADVAWVSLEIWEKIKHEADASIAPEICVEIISGSNTQNEMAEKRELYFAAGAKEVWLCNENGEMRFFDAEGKLPRSTLAPEFPGKIAL
jgi:Uma2 family endonuclease